MDEQTPLLDNSDTGYEVQITRKINNKLELDQDALSKVLCHPSIGKRPISIVSIVGAFRKGKSFLLNFFLEYLHNRGYENSNWMGGQEATVEEGFTWSCGSDAVTTGITMWSEPFIMNCQGKEVAILLMDTPGAFETNESTDTFAQIFTISLLMSSIVIYNLQTQIQEDNLQSLEYFMSYAECLKEKKKKMQKPTLMFLIRDYCHELEYGLEGGKKTLNKVISKRGKICSNVTKTFEKDLHCFLLPHPGDDLLRSRSATVQNKVIDEEFLLQVGKLANIIFHPKSTMLKKMMGGNQLVNIIINSWKTFAKLSPTETIRELASRNYAMECQFDAENEYYAAVRQILTKNVSYDEFISQLTQEQEKVEKSYRGQISRCLKNDIDAGTRTLQSKLKQIRESFDLNYQMEALELKLKRRNSFENRYQDEIEKISDDIDNAPEKLAKLHETKKHELGEEFTNLTSDEIEVIMGDMEKCFQLNKVQNSLKKKYKSFRKTEECFEKITEHLSELNQKFSGFLKELSINDELEQDLKNGFVVNVTGYAETYVLPIQAKINMAKFEEKRIKEIRDKLKNMKLIYFQEAVMEKTFNDIKWSFLKEYNEIAKKNNHEFDLETVQQFIKDNFEPEFELARRINAQNERYVNWNFKMDLLRIKMEYNGVMHKIIDSSYVKPDDLEEVHKSLVSSLCKKWTDLHEVETDVMGSVTRHVEIIENNLSDMYEEFKKWNEQNKSFFKKIAGGITGVTAAVSGGAAGGGIAILIAELEIVGTIGIISATGVGAAVIAGIGVAAIATVAAAGYIHKKQKQHMATKKETLLEEKKKMIDYSHDDVSC